MSDWMPAIFFGVYCSVGFVTILPAAEETVHPEKRIPAALIIGPIITGTAILPAVSRLSPSGPDISFWP
ncbi:MAG: hypothetical protein LBT14_07045 [Treponema sp.]|nr:hypothetical protein [Treponema sp.]